MAKDEQIELYDEGEYCEDVIDGETCIDRMSNTKCNACLRRMTNISEVAKVYGNK